MRKFQCISSAPDQPRFVLAEKRRLVGRQREELHLPQPLGLDKSGVAQNSSVLLVSAFAGWLSVPRPGTCE